MAEFPTYNGIPLHGTVGSLSEPDENAERSTADISRLGVFVSGAGVSSTGAVGSLEEDLRLLVQAFIQRSHSGDRETTPDTPASGAHGDIKIALHGLNVTPGQERELHHLIRELVRKRVPGKGAAK